MIPDEDCSTLQKNPTGDETMLFAELRRNEANVYQGRPIQKSEAEKEAYWLEITLLEEQKSGKVEQKVLCTNEEYLA
ncbi:unnamed protein product [Rhizophagus irregularis]|nr:unnamed protein product [Rhizophagus irregularis]